MLSMMLVLECGFHVHLAEFPMDQVSSVQRFNERCTLHLNRMGILNEQTLVAHAVDVDDHEINALRDTKSFVSLNAQSNMNNSVWRNFLRNSRATYPLARSGLLLSQNFFSRVYISELAQTGMTYTNSRTEYSGAASGWVTIWFRSSKCTVCDPRILFMPHPPRLRIWDRRSLQSRYGVHWRSGMLVSPARHSVKRLGASKLVLLPTSYFWTTPHRLLSQSKTSPSTFYMESLLLLYILL